jgi:hypothetical protein
MSSFDASVMYLFKRMSEISFFEVEAWGFSPAKQATPTNGFSQGMHQG